MYADGPEDGLPVDRSLVMNSDDDYCARTKNKQGAKTADKWGRDGREIKDLGRGPGQAEKSHPDGGEVHTPGEPRGPQRREQRQ